jgi:hypothetical protein
MVLLMLMLKESCKVSLLDSTEQELNNQLTYQLQEEDKKKIIPDLNNNLELQLASSKALLIKSEQIILA